MKTNPDKFQDLQKKKVAIGKTSMDKTIVLDLAGNKLNAKKK